MITVMVHVTTWFASNLSFWNTAFTSQRLFPSPPNAAALSMERAAAPRSELLTAGTISLHFAKWFAGCRHHDSARNFYELFGSV